MGELCADEIAVLEAVKASGRYISPGRLHAMYERFIEHAQSDWDFGGHVLTYLTRQGSRPVDRAVGERVVRRLAGR